MTTTLPGARITVVPIYRAQQESLCGYLSYSCSNCLLTTPPVPGASHLVDARVAKRLRPDPHVVDGEDDVRLRVRP
eukprot:9311358-Pyramimonas_sp.AAC.4